MDVTATQGAWKRNLWRGVAFAALGSCAYLYAPLAPLLSLALPLVVCPAYAQGHVWFALALPVAPAAAWLLGGGDWVQALLLPLCAYLCLLVLSQIRRRRLSFHTEVAAYAAAFVLGALGMLARLGMALGGALFPQLSEAVISALQRSVLGGSVLYKLVALGVLTIPEAYVGTTTIQLGNMVLMDPDLQRELFNMLRLRLTEGFAEWIPTLLMQGGILVGLWAALATTRVRARLNPSSAPAPTFRGLSLSRTEQGYMLLLCIVTLLTGLSDDSFLSLLSTLTYSCFAAVYRLLGAAVVLTLLSRRRPQRIALYGLFAAFLYLVVPFVLFLLGVADQFMHLRGEDPQKKEEE